MRPWPRRNPEVDERLVGLSFVEVLFALVIARILEPFANVASVPAVGIVQLVLAAVLTLTSWVGYHNSRNRPTYFIRFPNLPLFQFLTDILLVVLYWLTAVTAEGAVPSVEHRASALPETILVAGSFALYVVWDNIGLRMRKDDRYERRPHERDVPARRKVTQWCFFISFMVAIVVWFTDRSNTPWVISIDGLLIALILLFRFWKEYETPVNAYGEDSP